MFAEDLTPFFDADSGFASTGLLAGVSVTGIFDDAYTAGGVGAIGMADTQPALTLPTAVVPAVVVGASYVRDAITYRVAAHEPDGAGVSVLFLERVL